ncbi:hypothetical protein ABKV19_022699 [Rosa sericea]
MASTPGILTDWPWTPLGSFKYVVLAPWVIHSTYSFMFGEEGTDLFYILVFPFLLWRMLHNQIWISLSRYQTAKGKGTIVDKGLEFEQVDRERDWDDQIIFNGILFYIVRCVLPKAQTDLPIWRGNGLVITMLLHAGPVEYLYYWLHRALHHHFLYSRYHSHHHSSIVTEPITSVTHPFAEHITYFMLFAIPMVATLLIGTASISSYFVYITYIDFMNNLGHCNFEFIPNWIFSLFPPLKYLMYTPSYHSLHHTQFRTNYSLFMPIYDYIYGTMDKSSDTLHESSLRKEESPDGEGLNNYGGIYIQRNPRLKVKVVDGSSLAVAVILNSIPKGTTQVLLTGNLTKVAYALAFSLCQRDIQLVTLQQAEYLKLTKSLNATEGKVVHDSSYAQKIWLVGDGLSKKEQLSAPKGTIFVPFSQFPPKQLRRDCFYHYTPAMKIPKSLENVYSCENWLPRRVMSAWRIAGIVHALEGWNEHECGYTMSSIDKVWQATLRHGFQPLISKEAAKID